MTGRPRAKSRLGNLVLALLLAAPGADAARSRSGRVAPDAGTPARPAARPALSQVDDQPIELSADSFVYLGREKRAVYTGDARAVRGPTTLTCDELTVHLGDDQKVQRMEAVGHVQVVEGDRRASGERADFDHRTGVLVVTGTPEAHQGNSHVTGSRVTFTVESDVIEVEQARTLVSDAPVPGARGGQVRIASDRLYVYRQKNQAVWLGRVRARRDTLDLRSDKLVAHYVGQELTELQAFGRVQAQDRDQGASGERAVFDNRTGVLVVTGDPQARQGPNRMRGTKVTFTVGKDTLEVENAVSIIHTDEPPRRPKR